MRLVLSNEAQADMTEIFLYDAANLGLGRASCYIDDLAGRMKSLAASDLSGTKAEEIGSGLRRLVSGLPITFHLAEIAVTGQMVRAILTAIRRLRAPPSCA